jgi:hypothetical protein
VTACVPPLEQRRFIRVEHTLPPVTAPFAARKRGGPQIPLHGAHTKPEMLRNGAHGPALAVQRPDLLVHLLSTRLALGRAPLGSGQGAGSATGTAPCPVGNGTGC